MDVLTQDEITELVARVSARIQFADDTDLNQKVLNLAATVAAMTIQEREKMLAEKQ